jgi:hypothetical protein
MRSRCLRDLADLVAENRPHLLSWRAARGLRELRGSFDTRSWACVVAGQRDLRVVLAHLVVGYRATMPNDSAPFWAKQRARELIEDCSDDDLDELADALIGAAEREPRRTA